MAHELTLRANGRAEMAFTGETPWHGLGQSVTKGASIGVWQREAGMDWEAVEADVRHDLRNPDPKQQGWVDFPGYKGLYRSDTLAPLSIVGTNYNVVQPKEVLEFFRDLVEGNGGWNIHTAGTLRGGRKLWAMASDGTVANVGKGDAIKNNLLLATSMDGSMRTTAMLTSVRVVCANTMALALSTNSGALRISHRSAFNPGEVKRALGVARESFEVFMEDARAMADTPVKMDEALEVLRKVFGAPLPPKETGLEWLSKLPGAKSDQDGEDGKESRSVMRCLELFDGAGMGASMGTSKGTRWGLFNAVTQHVDHEMGRSADTRLDSAWFGRGSGFKQEALDLLVL